jgi:DnaJ-class molecular chaperone
MRVNCPNCDGGGWLIRLSDGKKYDCSDCWGTGKIEDDEDEECENELVWPDGQFGVGA